MRINIFGKYYGWCPIYTVDLHLNTGTVMRHLFYKWGQRGSGFRWGSPNSLNFKTPDTISGWNVIGVKYKFMWGADADLWNWKD